jgi:hypothetical protein
MEDRKMKKLFMKATMETRLQAPDLSGKPGYGGIEFPLKAEYCEEGRFTVDEIQKRVERAVKEWDCEVATLGGDDPNSIVTEVMKRPGEYWFSQNGYKEENPMLFWEGVDGMFYVAWDNKSYAIVIYGENPYMEAGEILFASVDDDDEKVFVTAYQSEWEISFEASTAKSKKEFYDGFIEEMSEFRYLDLLDENEASAARTLIGSNVACHLDKFTEFERWEMLNAENAFGTMFTEGRGCFAVMCVPVVAEK